MRILGSIDLTQGTLSNPVLQQLAAAPTSPSKGQYYMSTVTNTMHYYNGTADYDTGFASHSVSEMLAPTANFPMAGFKLTNQGLGVASTDGATMLNIANAIDAMTASIAWKPIVRLVNIANVASLSASGLTSIDSVTLNSGDRVLLVAQTTASQNGVYTWATGGALTRAGDSVSNYELQEGSTWEVTEGTTSGAPLGQPSRWYVSNTGVITSGTTAVTIIQIGAGNGVYIGSQYITVTGQTIAIPFGTFPRKTAAAFGNGSATSYTITHGLGLVAVNGIYPVVIQVYDASGYLVGCDEQTVSSNTATLSGFTTAPAANALTAVFIG